MRIEDLFNVVKVNRRFADNAGVLYALTASETSYTSLQHFATQRFLEPFGHIIKELSILKLLKSIEIIKSELSLIGAYCTNITSLKFMGPFTVNVLESFSVFFPRLHYLEANGVDLSQSFIDMLGACSNLTTLELIDCGGDWKFTSFTFPQLETLRLENRFRPFSRAPYPRKSRNMIALLANNPQLKHIKITLTPSDRGIMLTIARNLRLIETIEIVNVSGIDNIRLSFREQRSFQHLKKLILGERTSDSNDFMRRYPEEIMKFLAFAKAPLEHLEMNTMSVPPNNFIGEFEKLSVLKLPGPENGRYRQRNAVKLNILEKLRELTELHLNDCFEFDRDDFVALVRRNKQMKNSSFASNFHFSKDTDRDVYYKTVRNLKADVRD